MDRRNKLGLYGAYFCGMAGIGFTLPYLPLYLRGEGFSDRAISFVSARRRRSGVAQFPCSDSGPTRWDVAKPFLLAMLALLVVSRRRYCR